MELCTTVLACDTADELSKGAVEVKSLFRVLCFSETTFLLDVSILFMCVLVGGAEEGAGRVWGFIGPCSESLLRGREENPRPPAMSRHDPSLGVLLVSAFLSLVSFLAGSCQMS